MFFANQINSDIDENPHSDVMSSKLRLKQREVTSASQQISSQSSRREARPVSWCVASKPEPSFAALRKEKSKSEDCLTKSSGLVNTVSLAEELSAAAAETNEFKFPSGFFPISTSKSLNLATLYDDLGSPDVIEPPSLADSGYYQEVASPPEAQLPQNVARFEQDVREVGEETEETERPDTNLHPSNTTPLTTDTLQTPTNDLRLKTPDQVRVLNEVNNLRSDGESTQRRSERALWLQGLLSASLCNRCKSSASFDVMQRSLEERNKSPDDMYIDDAPNPRNANVLDHLTLEFQGQGREASRYDVDKSALQINFQTTPMDESVDLTSVLRDGDDVIVDLSDVDVTHRCCHKFVPRHRGELFIEIGDPLYVEAEEDDLWSKGKWKLIKYSFKRSNKLHMDGMGFFRHKFTKQKERNLSKRFRDRPQLSHRWVPTRT